MLNWMNKKCIYAGSRLQSTLNIVTSTQVWTLLQTLHKLHKSPGKAPHEEFSHGQILHTQSFTWWSHRQRRKPLCIKLCSYSTLMTFGFLLHTHSILCNFFYFALINFTMLLCWSGLWIISVVEGFNHV